ncbi:MAG TPA: proton-conducting transporter membrane subunit, partial [Beijerinckiaceae bacterium]
QTWGWMPSLGLDFTLRMDGFAWLFATLISGIGCLVALYARYYMSREDPVPRFFAFLLAFMGSMLGVVLSGNLVQLSFFWELTGLFSFLLIGYWHQSAGAREGARMALLVTGAGGLCLFAGVLLIGAMVGSYDLDVVLASGDKVRAHPLYHAALVLVLLGAFTKSAQFPFHFWLPHAMAAPTPVSAYLHSVTLVKAGVFLMARLWPVMAGTDAWFWIVGTAGLLTLLVGAYVAIFQHDLKGLLAYSTISHLGLITLLLGLNTALGMVAAIFHLINHAMFKASLFMAAGIIDHETGTRDIRKLSGLRRTMPFTARLAMVAAAAMAGVPLLNGFLSKEMFFEEAIAAPSPFPGAVDALPIVAMVASAFSVTYSLRFIHGAFFGRPATDLPREAKEPPGWMRLPVEILVLACIAIGVLPQATIGPFLHTAAGAILREATPAYSLAIWHGFTLPLLLSVLAFLGGVLLYMLLQRRIIPASEGPPLLAWIDARRMFERALAGLSWRIARPVERFVGARGLQPQLRLVVLAAILAGGASLLLSGVGPGNLAATPLDPLLIGVWAMGATFAFAAAAYAKFHRLAALVFVGGVGLVACVTFVWFSAPDLALTQLLVEIVTTVLLLLGLRWLPIRREDSGAPSPEIISLARRSQDLA